MKAKNILLALSLVLASSLASHAKVGIGTSSPNASAALDITSIDNNKGFLPPRLTTVQRDAISSPAVGLVIFNTTTNCLNFYIIAGWHEACGQGVSSTTYPAGSVFCPTATTLVVNVVNPTTGKIWMDRNLGANRAATSSTDAESYGSLFQWGRRADGHQCVNRYGGEPTSPNTATNATENTDTPNHGNFIIISDFPYDWRSPQNTNLWQGVNGINNPCPSGYRLPTEIEINAERLSWSQNNSVGAFASPLKLPMAGFRQGSSGTGFQVGNFGYIMSSTVSGIGVRILYFNVSSASMGDSNKSNGWSVRCLKD